MTSPERMVRRNHQRAPISQSRKDFAFTNYGRCRGLAILQAAQLVPTSSYVLYILYILNQCLQLFHKPLFTSSFQSQRVHRAKTFNSLCAFTLALLSFHQCLLIPIVSKQVYTLPNSSFFLYSSTLIVNTFSSCFAGVSLTFNSPFEYFFGSCILIVVDYFPSLNLVDYLDRIVLHLQYADF